MDKNKLAALAEAMMLSDENAGDIGDGAEQLVSYIKRIEDFTENTRLSKAVADQKGEILTDTACDKTCGKEDEGKNLVSMSKRSDNGFVVIPRVV